MGSNCQSDTSSTYAMLQKKQPNSAAGIHPAVLGRPKSMQRCAPAAPWSSAVLADVSVALARPCWPLPPSLSLLFMEPGPDPVYL